MADVKFPLGQVVVHGLKTVVHNGRPLRATAPEKVWVELDGYWKYRDDEEDEWWSWSPAGSLIEMERDELAGGQGAATMARYYEVPTNPEIWSNGILLPEPYPDGVDSIFFLVDLLVRNKSGLAGPHTIWARLVIDKGAGFVSRTKLDADRLTDGTVPYWDYFGSYDLNVSPSSTPTREVESNTIRKVRWAPNRLLPTGDLT